MKDRVCEVCRMVRDATFGGKVSQHWPQLAGMLTKQRLAACLLVLVAGAAMFVRTQAHNVRQSAIPHIARKANQPIPVRTTLVSQSDVIEVIGATGVTAPSNTVTVITGRASQPGPSDFLVKAIHVQPGSLVARGTVLVEFDDVVFQQVLKHRQAELEAAAELREQPGRLESREQILDAEAAFQRARLNLELAKLDLQSCRPTATVDGFVGELQLAPGDRVEFGRVLTNVEQLNPVHVVVDLPQERIKQVCAGQMAEVEINSFPGETFVGTLVQVPSSADPKTRTLPVVVAVPNGDYRIKAGVTAFARLQITKNTLTIPSIAAIKQGEKAMVFRIEQKRAKIREISLGSVLDPGIVEVLDGLSSGDEVVVHGNADLQDNDPVDTDWEEWSGRRAK